MDTSVKSWTLTLATVAVIALITAGHLHMVVATVRTTWDVAWWLISG